jgi:DNA polymerase-3 subunit chi
VTEIAFHFGASDKFAYAGRLLRKAAGSGARLAVLAEESDIAQLDADLWNLSPTDFVAHCTTDAAPQMRRHSQVLLCSEVAQIEDDRSVLVNLGPSAPQEFARFDRLIEIVAQDEEDRRLARQRWKHYSNMGCNILRHDVTAKGSP